MNKNSIIKTLKYKIIPCIAVTAMLSASSAAYATEVYLNDGVIKINGKIADAELGDILTINVVKSEFDWDLEDMWNSGDLSENAKNLKYYDTVSTDANGKYSIKFKLDEMGKYNVYLGSEYYDMPIVNDFYYTNKDENIKVVSALNKAESKEETARLLKENRYALMLYSDKYESVDLDEVGGLVYEYISKAEKELSPNETVAVIYQGFMVNFLNTADIKDISDYSDCLGMDESAVAKYIKKSFGTKIAELLKNADLKTISDYDEEMFYAASGCIIKNNDGIEGIRDVLNEHIQRSGSIVIVTDDMCKKIAGNALYTKGELENWIKNYKPTSGGTTGGSGSSGSSGGSGGGYKSGSYDAASKSPFNAGYDVPEKPEISELDGIFTDLKDVEWAKVAIESLYSKGIVSGRGERIFAPNVPVLREEFVKMLIMTFNLNLVSDDMNFKDVDKNAWYEKFISCAYASGIAKGYSDEIFGIGENITRQDICVMTDNALKLCEVKLDEVNDAKVFADGNCIADYAEQAVGRMQRAGIVNGYEDGSFRPEGIATRAEAAKLLYMISSYVTGGTK